MAGSWLPHSLLRPFGRPVALFFHGVEKRIEDGRIQTNHHDLNTFRGIARLLKENFDVLPLNAMSDVLRRPERHRRAVFLMCDDGYENNLTVAADVLTEYALPWTLFVSTHHIDTAERSPTFRARLFFFFAANGQYAIPNLSGPVVLGSASERERAADRWLGELKALDAPRGDEAVGAMEAALKTSDLSALLERFRSDRFLTWPQIAVLKKRGVEIGAHAHRHWAMHAGQSADYLREQASLARGRVEAEIGPCRYFAYPFGNTLDICPQAWRAVREAGYEYAFTTLSGSLDASINPYLLPRYGIGAREPRLASLVPLLRLGNARLVAWQRQITP